MSINTISKSIQSVRSSNYGAGDVIDFHITPEECAMLNPSETVIKFIINMEAPEGQPANTVAAQLDGLCGGYAVFDTIQIYAGNDGTTLLEQLDEVNHFMSMYMHYSQTPSLNNFWSLTCGKCPNNENLSLYYNQQNAGAAIKSTPVECVLKLPMSGIFGGDGKLFPTILTGGLRVRIQLASTEKSVMPFLPPLGVPVRADYNPEDLQPALCYELNTPIAAAPPAVNQIVIRAIPQAGGVPAPNLNNCPIKVGQFVGYGLDNNNIADGGLVQSVALDANDNMIITLQGNLVNQGAAAAGNPVFVLRDSCRATWTMSRFEVLTSCAEADKGTLQKMIQKSQSEGGLAVDYPSYNLIRSNLNARVSNPQVELLTSEKRALSLLHTPVDTRYILFETAFAPVPDQMVHYQYNIANRLTPNRVVPVDRVANGANDLQFNAIHGSELEKALDRSQIPPRYQSNNNAFFTLGRALSRANHSFDANNHNIRLNLSYSNAANANTINKLLLTQVTHIRRCIITTENVSVDY
jgi:hypothetical protein